MESLLPILKCFQISKLNPQFPWHILKSLNPLTDQLAWPVILQALHDILRTSDGRDRVMIYLKKQRAVKRLTGNWDIHIDEDLVAKIGSRFGVENVKVVEKSIEKLAQMH